MSETPFMRRVVLLETDERAGLVAAVTLVCADAGVSLEIATGPGHVLLTFTAEEATVAGVRAAFAAVPGVRQVHLYRVALSREAKASGRSAP